MTSVSPPAPVRALLPVGIGLGIVVAFAVTYPIHGFSMPVGPDAPVYLWWTKLAGLDGLSAVTRPGVPGLALSLSALTGASLPLVYASLGAALAGAIGLAAAALASHGPTAARAPRVSFTVVAVLAGTFTAHLAGGYLANVAWAACFLSAAACLATQTRYGAWIAGGLVAAAGLSHPLFWPVAILILVLALPLTAPADVAPLDTERGQVAVALGLGVALFGVGMASTLLGPRPLTVPTSKDAYLRRSGLGPVLQEAFRGRFLAHWGRYLLPLSVPLAWFGVRAEPSRSFTRRFLRGWAIIVAIGVLGGMATAWWPAERLLTSAFVLPIGAALGIIVLADRLGRRSRIGGITAGAICAVALVAAAGFTWSNQRPFFDTPDARGQTFAARAADDAAGAPLGAVLVFGADAPGNGAGFEAARLDNVVRAALPADRIRSLRVLVMPHDDLVADGVPSSLTPVYEEEHDAIARIAFNEFTALVAQRSDDRSTADVVILATDAALAVDQERFPPWGPVWTSLLIFFVLAVAGLGWAMIIPSEDPRHAIPLAPAFGAGALIMASLAVDRVGLRLHGAGGILAIVVAAVPGYAIWLIGKRHISAEPSP